MSISVAPHSPLGHYMRDRADLNVLKRDEGYETAAEVYGLVDDQGELTALGKTLSSGKAVSCSISKMSDIRKKLIFLKSKKETEAPDGENAG